MVLETVKSSIETEEGTVEYIYGLTEKEIIIEGRKIRVYGVEAESIINSENESKVVSKDRFEYLTPDRFKARKFISMLSTNQVSPIHLLDIIEPKIEDYYKDFETTAKEK